MGGIASVATTAIQALGAVNTVLGAVDSFQNKSGSRDLKQQKQLNNLQLQQSVENSNLEKERLRLAAMQDEDNRRSALRSAMARQRASLGGAGVGSSDGSGRAILLGLFDETDEQRAQRDQLDNLKTRVLDTNIAQKKSVNTLQLSQLKEKNNLSKYTSALNSVSSIFND